MPRGLQKKCVLYLGVSVQKSLRTTELIYVLLELILGWKGGNAFKLIVT